MKLRSLMADSVRQGCTWVLDDNTGNGLSWLSLPSLLVSCSWEVCFQDDKIYTNCQDQQKKNPFPRVLTPIPESFDLIGHMPRPQLICWSGKMVSADWSSCIHVTSSPSCFLLLAGGPVMPQRAGLKVESLTPVPHFLDVSVHLLLPHFTVFCL
jgi:hypothetical protein